MFGGLGVWELIIVLVILLLLFGPSRLGDLGSALGKGIKGFKRAMKEPDEIDVTPPPPSEEGNKPISGSSMEKTQEASADKEGAHKNS